MPPLLTLAAAVLFASWVFLILPRLQGHLDPWEREYELAYAAYQRKDFSTAEQHLRTAYQLAEKHNSVDGKATVAQGLADVLEKVNRKEEAEQYRRASRH